MGKSQDEQLQTQQDQPGAQLAVGPLEDVGLLIPDNDAAVQQLIEQAKKYPAIEGFEWAWEALEKKLQGSEFGCQGPFLRTRQPTVHGSHDER